MYAYKPGSFISAATTPPIALDHDLAPKRSAAVKWVVLRSVATPHEYVLHPETTWNRMAKSERQRWEVVKVCNNRAEANKTLDEEKAAG